MGPIHISEMIIHAGGDGLDSRLVYTQDLFIMEIFLTSLGLEIALI